LKKLVIITGPTAVGKTQLCVQIAQQLNTVILSADSRQFYRELSIGTAKPTESEMEGIKHFFVDSHSIAEHYSVGDYEKDALAILEEGFKTKDVILMTGGSGMFLKVICEGLDPMPEVNLELRAELMQRFEKEGVDVLYQELANLDTKYAAEVDPKNHQRIVRALEVCLDSGKPFSSFRTNTKVDRPFEILKICLERPREILYKRIDQRMDIMLASGLLDEVKSVENYKQHNALQTVGYKEVFDYLDGLTDYEEMVRLLKRNTRRYAKKQLSWFRNQDNYNWVTVDENTLETILDLIPNDSVAHANTNAHGS
jgi:tRNA dimethylallyltransferase